MKPLAANTLLQNRYLIVHLIGKGGMGEVYLAIDQRLGSAVALKRTFFSGDVMLGSAFEREARTLARLRHSVLPKVSDHFIEDNRQYLIMEHIAGDDLAKRLEISQKPFPSNWVLFWADQLLDALDYLHTQEPPVIHRDIKPQNLKLTDENSIVLLDFGLSKNTLGETRSATTGSVVGYTPHYAPMEQIRGTGTDARSDIYSLSATLYQLLTNVVPPDVLTRADALISGNPDPIRPINEVNNEIPKKVSDVILKGMTVSQEQRFSGARRMQKALRDAHAGIRDLHSSQNDAFSAENYDKVQETPQSGLKTNIAVALPVESKPIQSFTREDSEAVENAISQTTVEPPKKRSNARFFTIVGFGAPLVLAIAAALGWLALHNSENSTEKISRQTPQAAATIVPTPEATIQSAANTDANANVPNQNGLTSNANIQNGIRNGNAKVQNSIDKNGKTTPPAIVKTTPKQTNQARKSTKTKTATTAPAAPKATPLPRILP